MKRVISAGLLLLLIGLFVSTLVGCGADIKAENERLKAENANLKAGIDKLRLNVQKLKEDAQKMAAEKDVTIASRRKRSSNLFFVPLILSLRPKAPFLTP
jgi:cell division protein FtsB